ncbi:LacI family DNA-binding transcriptional regulator [Paenarthrobacter sp. OM7]|uniref:LacI family DNA-binding transcriptional regulator n=1 Tax=Paenarthrobacter sp. OM7 TaxID=3041264 RepID=UPI0024698750|nr:LacI family DNA-binding transcriptional regulator [Paenarthrobacter sp. OM7]WGM20275.1 LacI family DNA-binding transcriptional regulator [Paenarthrobacter sp. OM7]
MVTRADVASLANVSPAVVSYVINGGPRPVSREARARVNAAIEALDYRPNAVASALRGGSTKNVGLLIPSPVNPYFAELAEVIEHELLQAGFLLSIGITHEDAKLQRTHVRSLIDRRVDGLLLISSDALAKIREHKEQLPPIVVVDRVDDTDSTSCVHVDNIQGAATAVEHLQSWGHRRIACISGPWPLRTSKDRVQGWREQQRRASAPHSPDLVAQGAFTPQGGAEAATSLLSPEHRMPGYDVPTAVFVSSDAQAHGVLHACSSLGLRVPEDISIVSFDGTQSARFTQPPLTTLRPPLKDIGASAVRLLLARIASPKEPKENLVFQGNLVVGGSCAPPKG